MLETTELVDGKEGKELDKLLKEYQDVTAKMSDLTEIRNRVVEDIKAICDHKAVYETLNYVIKINTRKGADKFDKKGLKEKYLDIFNEFNTVNESVSLVMGDIIEKGIRS